MLSYESSLAQLHDGHYYSKKAEKPVTLKTDSGVSLEIPGPHVLAQIYAVPWLGARLDAYRSGSAILTRPKGNTGEPKALHLEHLKKELLNALHNLPDLGTQEAGRPYRDLRVFITEATPGARAKYLADVIAQLRSLLPAYRAPTPTPEERAPAKTGAERLAAHRSKARKEEELTARDWLASFLTGWDGDEAPPSPGSRWPAAGLYASAAETIEDFIDCEEQRTDGGDYVMPRRRIFYAVADDFLGPRRRGPHGSAMLYTIPATSTHN
ncbi:hypothetical protein [Arthrobacter sp. 08Y14]|uniref:hypothetical protein n=1 Tax=Arthrobacter sp. 08Y14 TaxID=2058885 RepID=UPI000CE52B95|nr:hypothetical protein [Arthrobacter sp. 08Y14]